MSTNLFCAPLHCSRRPSGQKEMGRLSYLAVFWPLFSVFQEIFPLIVRARQGLDPDPKVIDEIFTFVSLLCLARTDLSAKKWCAQMPLPAEAEDRQCAQSMTRPTLVLPHVAAPFEP